MQKKETELLEKFERCLSTWIDLPKYVYTEEYRIAFIEFCKPRIEQGRDVKFLVVQVLDHETCDKKPYFEFDRKRRSKL